MEPESIDVASAAAAMGHAARGIPKPSRNPDSMRRRILERRDAEVPMSWKLFKYIVGIREDAREYIERVWSRKIPRVYEEFLMGAMNGDPPNAAAMDVLKTMTLMCRSLTPANLRADSNADALGLPSDVDLSHISTADLARMTRKELSAPLDVAELDRKAAHAKMMREKAKAVKAGHAKAVGAHGGRPKTGSPRGRQKKTAPDVTPPINGGEREPSNLDARPIVQHPPKEKI